MNKTQINYPFSRNPWEGIFPAPVYCSWRLLENISMQWQPVSNEVGSNLPWLRRQRQTANIRSSLLGKHPTSKWKEIKVLPPSLSYLDFSSPFFTPSFPISFHSTICRHYVFLFIVPMPPLGGEATRERPSFVSKWSRGLSYMKSTTRFCLGLRVCCFYFVSYCLTTTRHFLIHHK